MSFNGYLGVVIDPPLTRNGVHQAQDAGLWLEQNGFRSESVKPEYVFASQLIRAEQTSWYSWDKDLEVVDYVGETHWAKYDQIGLNKEGNSFILPQLLVNPDPIRKM